MGPEVDARALRQSLSKHLPGVEDGETLVTTVRPEDAPSSPNYAVSPPDAGRDRGLTVLAPG